MTSADIDLDRVRADTPGLSRRIHLNHAGASLSPTPVLDTVIDHLRLEAEMGGYEAAAARADAIDAVYTSIAALLGCDADDVALMPSATVAWETAFWSLPLSDGDVVLTSQAEYVSNALSLLMARDRRGIRIRVVADDESGQLDVDALERELDDPRVALVAVTHVPTQGGLVNPAAEIGARCRAASVPFLLDACQSVGQLPTLVDDVGCDLLSATGRKYLRAPREPDSSTSDRPWPSGCHPFSPMPARRPGSAPTPMSPCRAPGGSRRGSATSRPLSGSARRSTTHWTSAWTPSPGESAHWPTASGTGCAPSPACRCTTGANDGAAS